MRPVSSEDAMTADWTRLPYDVLARISTRITNSVPEVNRLFIIEGVGVVCGVGRVVAG